MPFLSFSNADVGFAKLEKFTWRLYTAREALLITRQVKLINKREFAKARLDKNSETFVMHVAALKVMLIQPFKAAKVQDNLILSAL